MLINKSAIRELIADTSPHIRQVKKDFYTILDRKVRRIVLSAVQHNASRSRLTQYELRGISGNGGKQ